MMHNSTPVVQRKTVSSQMDTVRSFMALSRVRWELTVRSVRAIAILLLSVNALNTSAIAQTLTVADLLSSQDQWPKWAQDGTKLQIDGRYEGRTGQIFRFEKLPITFQPPRNNPLPEKLRSGQRIEVSGRLRTVSSKLVFEVNRLSIGETDVERLQSRVQSLTNLDWEPMYSAADEFERIAEFYGDMPLKAEVQAVRLSAVDKERKNAGQSAAALWSLAGKAEKLKLDSRLTAEIQFESLIVRWKRQGTDLPELLKLLESHLSGWDLKDAIWDERREARFQASPVSAYHSASDPERQLIHRRLYRAVQQQRLRGLLLPDGSNGIAIAKELRELAPEEADTAVDMEQKEISYRLQRVTKLTRAELQQLMDLLKQHDRASEIVTSVDAWVKEQEARFARTGLAGLIRSADEYVFAADRWNRPEHRERGVELLKQAWETASKESPADAAQIADRLRRFGWERLKDRWMTSAQIQSLPDDDVQLAMREGRVVRGMLASQVIGTLGQPAAVSRIISSRNIRELWVYDAPGSAGVIVQFERLRGESPATARVASITRTSSR